MASEPQHAFYRQPRWHLVGFLTLAAALNYADRAALSAVLPALRTDLGLSDVSLGLLGSAFLWAYALGSPIAGSIADRWSRSRIVVLSLVAWSAVTALMGAAIGFPMLMSLRVGLGITECFFLPAAFALIARHHGVQTRARAMSLISIGINGGMVLGGAAAGFLAEHYGWRTGFTVFGLLGLAAAFLSRWTLPAENATHLSPKPRGISLFAALKYLAGVRTFHVLMAESVLTGMGMWIFYAWLPLYFRDTFNLSLAAAGFAGTFMLQISVLLGISVGGWLSDRVAARGPERRLLAYALCYLVAAPFLLLFVGTPGFAVVVFSISAFSFFRGVGQTNDNPSLCEVVPEHLRSTAVGLMNACATGAGGCGVLLAGYLKGSLGLNTVFAGISGAFVVAALLLLFAYRFTVGRDIARARAEASAR